ncbi:MAG TPA: GNAT family N-acetyltransferase [Anaerolineales bacterium]|nr:GNAT family N-acetyltransferase [Anaerolineales bacterium]
MSEWTFSTSFPRLETQRLVLREFTLADAPAIFRNFSDEDVTKWFFDNPFIRLQQAKEISESLVRNTIHTNTQSVALLERSGFQIRRVEDDSFVYALERENWTEIRNNEFKLCCNAQVESSQEEEDLVRSWIIHKPTGGKESPDL